MISKNLLGRGTARSKGTCDNLVNIRRDALEASVLDRLRTHLMDPALFHEFGAEFTREVNRLRMEESASLESARSEVAKIDRELDRLMKLILASDDVEASKRVMRQMTELERRKEELKARLAEAEDPPPLLHPNLAEAYRERLDALNQALDRPDAREEAPDVIRSLVSAIELTPENGDLAIVLRGDLAAMLSFAGEQEKARRSLSGGGAFLRACCRKHRWLRG